MVIAKVTVSGVIARATYKSKIPQGIVGATVEFDYADPMWAGLKKTVIFWSSAVKDILDVGESVVVPPEVVAKAGCRLRVGIYGEDLYGNVVIPTLWADLGPVMSSANPGLNSSGNNNLDLTQLQKQIGDLDQLQTQSKVSLVAAINEMVTGFDEYDKAQVQQITDLLHEALQEAQASGAFDGPPGPAGDDGKDGITPALSIGTVETLDAGDKATASITGTKEKPVLNLGIPKGVPGEGGTAVVETFTTKPIGQLFDQPVTYSFWCPQTLVYDPNIDKYVDLIFGTTSHLADDSEHTLWVSYIDPKTYEATKPEKCVYKDGETVLTMPEAGCAVYIILDDGRYMQINRPSSASSDYYLFYSSDHGKTWIKGEKANGYAPYREPYFIKRLSNGRLLTNDTAGKKIHYSDDNGLNWSNVTPATCGGDMESEINFFEVKPGVVIAIGRYSMQGMGVFASGDSQHAIISYSYDYGTTWTPWKLSETIDNMNASCCTGYLHDGILELFCGSRWYYNGSNVNTDYTNTGKTGAITHYTATIENALADNFTNAGVVVYAKAKGNISSQDFHTPCVAVNGKEMLMVYADRVYPYTIESTNHYFVRGYLGGSMDYAPNDEIVSPIFPYSSQKVKQLLMLQKSELITLINEVLMSGGGGGGTPVLPDDEELAVYTTDGLLMYFNMTDGSKYDADNLTITDIAHGLTAKLASGTKASGLLTELPEIREKSASASVVFEKGSNPLANYIGADDNEFTYEWSMYQYSDLPKHSTDMGFALQNEGWVGIAFYGGGCGEYVKTDSTRTGINACLMEAGYKGRMDDLFPVSQAETHYHCVITMANDGTLRWYKNGNKILEVLLPDFLEWDKRYFSGRFCMGGNCRALRFYKKALSDKEVLGNYNYEKQFYV